MANLPANFAHLLREAGLTVVEVEGWRFRGRPASTGGFAPVGSLNHHTGASARGWTRAKELAYAKWMFLTGRSDLPAPLCQVAIGRSGTIYVGAAGRANHAGTAKAVGSVAAGDGNRLYVGWEWMLSGTEEIPKVMYEAAVTANAVLTAEVLKHSVEVIACHFQTSVTGKWDIGDPNGVPFSGHKVLDVAKFRRAVAARRKELKAPARRTLSVALVNVPIKVGEKAWTECFRKAAKSDIFGLNECVSNAQRKVYDRLAEAGGLGHAGLASRTTKTTGNPIFWDKDQFRVLSRTVHVIHTAGTGDLAERYPGYNSERTINEVVLTRVGEATEYAVLNTHLVPNGRKVPNLWRERKRAKSKRMLRRIARVHRKEGRVVVVMGDMNVREPFWLGRGMKWLKGEGIDKIGSNRKGVAHTFKAPTDHKRGVRATIND